MQYKYRLLLSSMSVWVKSEILTATNIPVVAQLPELTSGRILLTVWLFTSFITSTGYSGALVSMMTVPKVDLAINSLEDLASVGFPIATSKGGLLEAMIQVS